MLEVTVATSDPVGFFEKSVPQLLQRGDHGQFGGRYGVRVGTREWVVDLSHGRVTGDIYGSVVTDDDALDAIVVFGESFLADRNITIYADDAEAVMPFIRWLESAARA
jgi:hypothetical protein